MGLISALFGSGDEHHETPCNPDGKGPYDLWMSRPRNPMGYGNNDPRVIKHAGRQAHDEDGKPAMHGSKAERTLMAGTGALIRWSGDRVQVTGEGPGRQR